MFLFLSPLTFFGLPFFCFSFSVSLFLSCVSFFLLVFLLCFLFVSCFCLFFIFLSSLLLFHEKNNMNIFNCNFFFSWNIFSFFWFPVLLFCFNPFFLSLLFPDFKLCFLFNINVFSYKKNKLKSTTKRKNKLQQNCFFYEPVFCKMWKVIVFFAPFLPNVGSCSKTL